MAAAGDTSSSRLHLHGRRRRPLCLTAELDHAGRRAAEHERSRADGARPAGREEEPVAAAAELEQPRGPESQRAAAADRRRLELRTERPAGTEEEHLDRCDRRSEPGADLRVREPGELSQDEDLTLRGGQRVQRGDQRVRVLVWRLRRGHPVRVGLLLLRPAAGCPEACAADVLRDREQPGARRMRPRAAKECAVRVGEGGLRHILGVVHVAELPQRGSEDLPPMQAVQAFERSIDLVARPVDADVHQGVNDAGPTADTAEGSLVRAMFGTPHRT